MYWTTITSIIYFNDKIMNKALFSKCNTYDFRKLFQQKGYAYFDKGSYNLNIIGIRSDNNNRVTNEFDDVMVVIYNNDFGTNVRMRYTITTDPGNFYMKNPLSAKGTGILVPGQYRGCWEIGLHQGKYKALVQRKPVKVYRDNNKDNIYDLKPETIEDGIFGVNIHKAGPHSTQVDKWSAACQVFANSFEFDTFMGLCNGQVVHGYGKTFTYTLLNEADL